MIPTHCRHKTYPKPPGLKMPSTCLAGILYADVMLPAPGPIWNRQPCAAEGRKNGATCPRFEPWSAEDVAEYEAEVDAVVAGLTKGECSDCGKKLARRGAAFSCPDGHVSGFMCGEKDIKDGPY